MADEKKKEYQYYDPNLFGDPDSADDNPDDGKDDKNKKATVSNVDGTFNNLDNSSAIDDDNNLDDNKNDISSNNTMLKPELDDVDNLTDGEKKDDNDFLSFMKAAAASYCEDDNPTIGGFLEYIEQRNKQNGPAYSSTFKSYLVFHDYEYTNIPESNNNVWDDIGDLDEKQRFTFFNEDDLSRAWKERYQEHDKKFSNSNQGKKEKTPEVRNQAYSESNNGDFGTDSEYIDSDDGSDYDKEDEKFDVNNSNPESMKICKEIYSPFNGFLDNPDAPLIQSDKMKIVLTKDDEGAIHFRIQTYGPQKSDKKEVLVDILVTKTGYIKTLRDYATGDNIRDISIFVIQNCLDYYGKKTFRSTYLACLYLLGLLKESNDKLGMFPFAYCINAGEHHSFLKRQVLDSVSIKEESGNRSIQISKLGDSGYFCIRLFLDKDNIDTSFMFLLNPCGFLFPKAYDPLKHEWIFESATNISKNICEEAQIHASNGLKTLGLISQLPLKGNNTSQSTVQLNNDCKLRLDNLQFVAILINVTTIALDKGFRYNSVPLIKRDSRGFFRLCTYDNRKSCENNKLINNIDKKKDDSGNLDGKEKNLIGFVKIKDDSRLNQYPRLVFKPKNDNNNSTEITCKGNTIVDSDSTDDCSNGV